MALPSNHPNYSSILRLLSRLPLAGCFTLSLALPLLLQSGLQAQTAPILEAHSQSHHPGLPQRSTPTDVLATSYGPKPLAAVRIERYKTHYDVNADYSYSRTSETLTTLLTPNSLSNWQRSSFSFYPDTQSLELVEAYVIQPDGRRLDVEANKIYTRPSSESQSAPGFTNSMTTTAVFPQLKVGSKVYSKWKLTQKVPSKIGLHEMNAPYFRYDSRQEEISVNLPKDLALRWAKRGDYQVTNEVEGDRRLIKATYTNYQGRQPEKGMTARVDVSPLFTFSNLSSWEDLGKIYWKQSKDKVEVTPEVEALAEEIVGDKTGIEAARAIYNWVTQNTEYLAVYLNESAGWIPHSVSEILKTGYGDCKDHVALMQSLLAARGIESNPVLVDWGYEFEQLPLPEAAQFNHAIIYLPEYDIFANPTDEYASFGVLETSLSDKLVVLATEDGKVMRTPASKPEDNRYVYQAELAIAPDGSITGTGELEFSGKAMEWARNFFASDTPELLAENLLSYGDEGGYGRVTAEGLEDLDQGVVVTGSWTSPRAVKLASEAYFEVPAGLSAYGPEFLKGYLSYTPRQYSLVVGARTREWSYRIRLPEGYGAQRLPEDVAFENGAGSYGSRYRLEGDTVVVNRRLVIHRDVYSAAEYGELEALIYSPLQDFRDVIAVRLE